MHFTLRGRVPRPATDRCLASQGREIGHAEPGAHQQRSALAGQSLSFDEVLSDLTGDSSPSALASVEAFQSFGVEGRCYEELSSAG